MKNIGIGAASLLRYYAAWNEDGVPVCTAVSWLCAGVLGIYSVVTLPSHRRKGLARAVVVSVLLDPAVHSVVGAPDVAVLQSSPDAFSSMQALGSALQTTGTCTCQLTIDFSAVYAASDLTTTACLFRVSENREDLEMLRCRSKRHPRR